MLSLNDISISYKTIGKIEQIENAPNGTAYGRLALMPRIAKVQRKNPTRASSIIQMVLAAARRLRSS
jgi:hypothetical protein